MKNIRTNRWSTRLAGLVLLATGLVAASVADTATAAPVTDSTIVICRATQEPSRPYVQEVVQVSVLLQPTGTPGAVVLLGMWTPLAPVWGDIVPPVAGVFPDGVNWPDGAGYWNSACVDPSTLVTGPPVTDPGASVGGPVVTPGSRGLPSTGTADRGLWLLSGGLLMAGIAMVAASRRPRTMNKD
jgi:LPXTG-motif cell wall-anchored protein